MRGTVVANTKTKYTLWTIPREYWSDPLVNITLRKEDLEKLIEFTSQFDDDALNDRLSPYKTPVTKTTLSKSTG